MKLLFCLLPLLFVQQVSQTQSGAISGQIRDSSGKPLSGVRVFAVPVERDSTGTRAPTQALSNIAVTSDDGRYLLDNVRPGRYVIGAGLLASPTYFPGVSVVGNSVTLTMTVGDSLSKVDFSIPPANLSVSELWGTVVLDDGSPLPADMLLRTQLIVSSTSKHWVAAPFTRQQGIFFFKGMDSGVYVFSVAPLPLGFYVKSMRYGAVDLTRARLDLSGGLKGTELNVVLTTTRPPGVTPGVKVSGRILGWRSGKPPLALNASAKVLNPAAIVTNTVAFVIPREDGTFEVAGVPPGLYTMKDPSSNRGESFEVAGSSDVAGLELNLDQSIPVALQPSSLTSIKGRVDVGDGMVPEFEIQFISTRVNSPTRVSEKVSTREFSAVVPQGEYRASISGLPKGYALVSVTSGPMELSEPFLVTGAGIADRFTGAPMRVRGAGGGAPTNAGITITLRVVPSNQ